MKKYFNLLDELKENGLDLYDSENIRYGAIIPDRYIIGNIPGSSENMEYVPFDIVFNAIETYWSMYFNSWDDGANSLYHELQQLNNDFNWIDCDKKDLFKKMKELCGNKNREFFNRIVEEFNDYMKDIIEEMRILLEEVKEGYYINELVNE